MYVEILVPIALFMAASLQAAGGLGFGLIAGPLMIALLGPTAGIQAAIILNLVVALLAWGLCRSQVQYRILLPMVPGVVAGISIGFLAALVAPQWLLKVSLCVALAWICLAPLISGKHNKADMHRYSLTSGLMGGALAIPGPAAALYLKAVTPNARVFRSSMMPLLVFVYFCCGTAFVVTQGIETAAIDLSITLSLVVILGLLFGVLVSQKVSETSLKRLTYLILVVTLTCLTVTTSKEIIALVL